MMYLITKSAYYYPNGGTGDWVAIRDDLESAREFFNTCVRQQRNWANAYSGAMRPLGYTWYLIKLGHGEYPHQIHDDNTEGLYWHVLEEVDV